MNDRALSQNPRMRGKATGTMTLVRAVHMKARWALMSLDRK